MIHWQYIKGAYQASSEVTIPYTFLDFAGAYNSNNQEEMLPKISIANTNAHPDSDLGHIMVSGIEQSFSEKINFNQGLSISTQWKLLQEESGLKIKGSGQIARFSDGISNLYTNITMNGYLIVGGTTTTHTTSGDLTANQYFGSSATLSAKCEAQYFNATSDRRAKTDIKPISQSVLPLVINTQLYSFKYKDLDTPSIGIIAQDVQDVNFDGFSLVDNKEATGQDMDYMSIHESKLIYVLWKAVQEQQKEIEELKAQIKKGL